jgi:hypothetical protein
MDFASLQTGGDRTRDGRLNFCPKAFNGVYLRVACSEHGARSRCVRVFFCFFLKFVAHVRVTLA